MESSVQVCAYFCGFNQLLIYLLQILMNVQLHHVLKDCIALIIVVDSIARLVLLDIT